MTAVAIQVLQNILHMFVKAWLYILNIMSLHVTDNKLPYFLKSISLLGRNVSET
jgi:hypothetical protein